MLGVTDNARAQLDKLACPTLTILGIREGG